MYSSFVLILILAPFMSMFTHGFSMLTPEFSFFLLNAHLHFEEI